LYFRVLNSLSNEEKNETQKERRKEEELRLRLLEEQREAERPEREPEIPEREPEIELPPITITREEDITIPEDFSKTKSKEDEEEEEGKGLVITHRTAAVHQFLTRNFEVSGDQPLSLIALLRDKKRNTAAITFFELLNIRSQNCINVRQDDVNYGDIFITKTEFYDRLTS